MVRFCLSRIGVAFAPAFTEVLTFMSVPFYMSIGVALPRPAFTPVLVFMFVPLLKEYRRGLEARFYSGFDFHVWLLFQLLYWVLSQTSKMSPAILRSACCRAVM
jgi:hypothetical protein